MTEARRVWSLSDPRRKNRLGARGERIAARTLVASGWTVLERNYRWGHKEIDLVVRRGALVAFVEVKTRTTSEFGHPLESITPGKRREIEQVARHWIRTFGTEGRTFRFDAFAVRIDGSGRIDTEHVENAWECEIAVRRGERTPFG